MSRYLIGRRVAGHRIADWGFVGAVIGFVISLVMFVVLFAVSIWLDMKDRPHIAGFSPCVLRLIALLGLTLGLGIGYMTARALGG